MRREGRVLGRRLLKRQVSIFQLPDHLLMYQQHKPSTARSRPSWQGLSPVLRIEILHGFVDQDVSPEIASSHLGISPEEWQETVKWDTQREQVSEREDTKIQGMQEEIHRLLLDGGPIIKVTTSAYNRIFDRHLGTYMRTDKWHFHVCTKKQLEIAHAFLNFRGLSRSLAGRWDELESGNTYDYRSAREKASRAEMSKVVEKLDGVIIQPGVNQKAQDPKVSSLITSSPVHERGRSPIRRRYITQSQETSPSASQATRKIPASQDLAVPQPQHYTTKRTPNPYRPIVIAPGAGSDTIMQDISNLFLPDQTVEPSDASLPLTGSTVMVPCQLPANDPRPILSTEQENDHSDNSTILVQPKRGWTGTARPTVRIAPHPSGNDSLIPLAQGIIQGMGDMTAQTDLSTGDPNGAMERLRRQSLKHTAKARPKPEAQTENGDQSCSQMGPNGIKPKNVKSFPVSTSLSKAKQAPQDPRRASTGSLTATSRFTTAATPEQSAQDSPDTPVKSGSSTRSSRATQLPARYRDDLVETPTAASRPRKSSQLKGLVPQATMPKAEVTLRKPRGRKAAAEKEEEEEEDEDADHTKRLATSPPGSREPPPKKQAGRKRATMPTPSASRSESVQSSRAESVVSTATKNKRKGKAASGAVKASGATAAPKATGKAPRKRPPRTSI